MGTKQNKKKVGTNKEIYNVSTFSNDTANEGLRAVNGLKNFARVNFNASVARPTGHCRVSEEFLSAKNIDTRDTDALNAAAKTFSVHST